MAAQSACNVDRIDAALSTILPMVPDLTYFRFCAEDARCGIDLDEIDPEQVCPRSRHARSSCHSVA